MYVDEVVIVDEVVVEVAGMEVVMVGVDGMGRCVPGMLPRTSSSPARDRPQGLWHRLVPAISVTAWTITLRIAPTEERWGRTRRI